MPLDLRLGDLPPTLTGHLTWGPTRLLPLFLLPYYYIQLVVINGNLYKLLHFSTYPPLPLVLISSGGHQSTYDWQSGGTHSTEMLSCFKLISLIYVADINALCIPDCGREMQNSLFLA